MTSKQADILPRLKAIFFFDQLNIYLRKTDKIAKLFRDFHFAEGGIEKWTLCILADFFGKPLLAHQHLKLTHEDGVFSSSHFSTDSHNQELPFIWLHGFYIFLDICHQHFGGRCTCILRYKHEKNKNPKNLIIWVLMQLSDLCLFQKGYTNPCVLHWIQKKPYFVTCR